MRHNLTLVWLVSNLIGLAKVEDGRHGLASNCERSNLGKASGTPSGKERIMMTWLTAE